MTVLDALTALQTQGVGLLEAVRGMSKNELAAYGLRGATAGSWLRLADVFFGPPADAAPKPTPWPPPATGNCPSTRC